MARATTTLLTISLTTSLAISSGIASAQPTSEPSPAPTTPALPAPEPLPPAKDPLAEPPASSPANPPAAQDPRPTYAPPPSRYQGTAEPIVPEEGPKEMSEGRRIVVAWNTGFQWGLSPGIVFSSGKTGFFLGLRLGYGFDTDTVILVPGVRFAAYFTDPNVYLGMPVMKLVLPIDRFAPFVEGGAGVGYADGVNAVPGQTGAALFGGGGFMVHFTPGFALGVEANYQVITGTGFKGFGVGPIIALAF